MTRNNDPDVDDNPQPKLLTLKGAARALTVSTTQIYRLARTGQLEMIKVGSKTVRVTKESVDTYIKNAKRVIPNRKD